MTREHLYFIPIIFCLGVVLGSQITRGRMRSGPMSAPRVGLLSLMLPLAVFLAIFLLTHVFAAHGGAKAVGEALQGQAIFDQRASFSAAEVYERLERFGPKGRGAYQQMTFTTDLAFPVVLFIFLLQLARFVVERTAPTAPGKTLALLLPLAWLLADVAENATIYRLIAIFPEPADNLALLLGPLTSAKFALLLGAVAVPAFLSLSANRQPIRAPDSS